MAMLLLSWCDLVCLQMLAIPAIPLTMSAGLIFGVATGTALVSIAGTVRQTED